MFEIAEGGVRPELLLQLLAGDDSARLFEKRQQYPERLLLKPDRNAVLAQDTRLGIEFESPEANSAGLLRLSDRGPRENSSNNSTTTTRCDSAASYRFSSSA